MTTEGCYSYDVGLESNIVPWRYHGVNYPNPLDPDEELRHKDLMRDPPDGNLEDYDPCSCRIGNKTENSICEVCSEGKTTLEENAPSCLHCKKNYYVYQGQCIKCEIGENNKNDPIHGEDTYCSYYRECKPEICDDDESVVPKFPLARSLNTFKATLTVFSISLFSQEVSIIIKLP